MPLQVMTRELKSRQQVVAGVAGLWGGPVAGVISKVVVLYDEACSSQAEEETLQGKLQVGAMRHRRHSSTHWPGLHLTEKHMKLLLRQRYA